MRISHIIKVILPIVIILISSAVAWKLFAYSPKAVPTSFTPKFPAVETLKVKPQNVRIPVYTQGIVRPKTTINLAAEVTGRIVETASQFADGGFFKKDDLLVKINSLEYRLAINKAEAQVASAFQQFAEAEAEYKQKKNEYRGIDQSKITDFALRKPKYEEARAQLKAAESELELAKLQLIRTEIRAPFDGRIVEIKADVGQYVTPGNILAILYATDLAEIRLPLTQANLKMLSLPLTSSRNEFDSPIGVKLFGDYAGHFYEWEAEIVRTDASMDERNRLLYAIAQVTDPYGLDNTTTTSPPLAMGMFVEAELQGRLIENIFVLPRSAVHGKNEIWLLDESLRLRVKHVNVLYRGESHIYISNGLRDGEIVITSPLDAVFDGMQLRPTGVNTTHRDKDYKSTIAQSEQTR